MNDALIVRENWMMGKQVTEKTILEREITAFNPMNTFPPPNSAHYGIWGRPGAFRGRFLHKTAAGG
jgi:hypothetical protein